MDLSKFPVGAKAKCSNGEVWSLTENEHDRVWWDRPGYWKRTYANGKYYSGTAGNIVAILPCEATLTIGSEWRSVCGKRLWVRGITRYPRPNVLLEEANGFLYWVDLNGCLHDNPAIPFLVARWEDPHPLPDPLYVTVGESTSSGKGPIVFECCLTEATREHALEFQKKLCGTRFKNLRLAKLTFVD